MSLSIQPRGHDALHGIQYGTSCGSAGLSLGRSVNVQTRQISHRVNNESPNSRTWMTMGLISPVERWCQTSSNMFCREKEEIDLSGTGNDFGSLRGGSEGQEGSKEVECYEYRNLRRILLYLWNSNNTVPYRLMNLSFILLFLWLTPGSQPPAPLRHASCITNVLTASLDSLDLLSEGKGFVKYQLILVRHYSPAFTLFLPLICTVCYDWSRTVSILHVNE